MKTDASLGNLCKAVKRNTDPGNYPKYIRDVLSKIFKKKIQLSALLSEFVIMLKLGFLW